MCFMNAKKTTSKAFILNFVAFIKSIFIFCSYSPSITSAHHTCVGLALELWSRLHDLEANFPQLGVHLFLVSCEENIEQLDEYTALSERLDAAAYDLEKEHVLLCLKFQINERQGLLLCDPGYHVSRVVTVMHDKAYPHTGNKSSHNKKFSNQLTQ